MNDLPEVTIEAINLNRRLAICDKGYGKIESFLDADGDETQDVDIAVYATIEWFAGGWSTIELADYVDAPPLV